MHPLKIGRNAIAMNKSKLNYVTLLIHLLNDKLSGTYSYKALLLFKQNDTLANKIHRLHLSLLVT